MFPQLYRYLFATLCSLFVSPATHAAAVHPVTIHPISFTEAWVTISDRIEVKLRLFTDDIIRYDQNSEPLPEALSADEFNQILDRQTPELLRRVQLYVGGKRLTGSVTSVPDPWTSSDVIDVAGSANVKHTWRVEFQIPDRPVQSLTIRHSLSPPGIEQPGELRLHSRHKTWKQRIDAVIPPDLSYTVVYREAGNSIDATATANETTSRIIVSPFAITHEVTLPLTNVLAAFPAISSAQQNPASVGSQPVGTELIQPAESEVLTISQQQQLGQQLSEWIQQNTTVATEGKSNTKRMSTVQFFESGIIPEQPVPDSRPSPVLVPGTLVGLRQTYARSGTQDSGSLILKSAFPGISEIRCETIANNAANTSLQRIDGISPDSNSPSRNSPEGQTLHQWSTPPDAPQPTVGNDPTAATVSQNLILQRTTPGGLAAWLLVILGLGLTLSMIPLQKWSRTLSNRKRVSTAITVIGVAMIFAGFTRMPTTTYQSQTTTINQWMSAALEAIYQSLQAPTERQTVERLSHWLSDDMVESTYLTMCQQMAAEPEQATWTGIRAVHLHSAKAAEVDHPDALTVSCGWEVRGMAYHWGHAHQVTRRYSGVFELAETAADWKIRELTQLEADSSTTAP